MMRTTVITAILKKDLRGLWPLALGGALLFLVDALLSGIDLNVHTDVIRTIDGVLPVTCVLAMGLIIITVIQEDPADSLSHDWLTRPISSGEFAAAKLLTLFITIALPIFVSRFLVGLGTGHDLIESLLAASYARDGVTLAAFPFFATVALLSRSTVQAIVVSLAILTLAILPLSLPEVMAQPSPLALLDDGTAQGVWWLHTLPIVLLVCLALALVFAFQYVQRRFGLARTALAVTILLASPMMALPFFLPIWPMFFTLAQASLTGVDEEAAEGIRLYSMNDCFPAAKTADVTPGAYEHPENIIGEPFWREGEVYEISHGAVTYSTTLAARNVPDIA